MQHAPHLLPVLAKLVAGQGQGEAPGQRAKKGVDGELHEIHARDARRQRDEGSHDRHQARGKDRGVAVASEEYVSAIGVPGRDQHVAAVPQEQGAPADGANPVRDGRAHDATNRASKGCRSEVEAPLEGQKAGKRHDELARQRDAAALDRHSDDDPSIAGDYKEIEQRVADTVIHGSYLIDGVVPQPIQRRLAGVVVQSGLSVVDLLGKGLKDFGAALDLGRCPPSSWRVEGVACFDLRKVLV